MSRRLWFAGAAAVAVGAAVFVLRGGREPPADTPAPASQAPASAGAPESMARNPVEMCADCHPDEVDGFAKTGMGRALYRPADKPPIEDFTPAKATVVHKPTGLVYRAFVDEKGTWWQSESLPGTDYDRRVEVKYVVGSGNHTRSYIGEVEGELVELPLTWYVRRGIWDMSPGYVEQNFRFTRPIKPQCIFCHNDLTPLRADTMAGYAQPLAQGISCVRCHGDGAEHVRTRQAGKGPPPGQPDPTILNPARLPPQGQQRICEQCHLQGEARVLKDGHTWDHYDPRTPLGDYVSIYVPVDAGGSQFSIASHGYRLSLSKCFRNSDGRLACTTCHDPHKPGDPKSHREACLGCHETKKCGDAHGAAPDADCAGCHMHKGGTSDIPHVTFTDHFIRKHPESEPELPAAYDTTHLVDALAPAVATEPGAAPAPGSGPAPDPKEALRMGLAHLEVARFGHVPDTRAHLPLAIALLQQATKALPERADAWQALGDALQMMRNAPEAAEAYRKASELAPDKSLFLPDLSEALEAQGKLPEAEAALRKAVQIRPDYRVAWGNLANNLARQGKLDEAEQMYAKADALAPFLSLTAENRGQNALSRGQPEEAKHWFEEAIHRDPTDSMGYFGLAMVLLQQGDADGAIARLDETLKRDDTFGLGHWLRSRARMTKGDKAGARQDLERLISLDPMNPNGYAELSRVLAASGDAKLAEAAIMHGITAIGPAPELTSALDELKGRAPPPPPP